MRYTVIYNEQALADLTRYWMWASDRKVVTAAANEIERLLKTTPLTCGEETVTEGSVQFRSLTFGPLKVLFTVSPDDRMVRVFTFRLVSPP